MSNTEELKYVKYPLTEDDFSEEDIKYTIPAKDFYNLINALQDQITLLSKRVSKLEEKVFNLDPYYF